MFRFHFYGYPYNYNYYRYYNRIPQNNISNFEKEATKNILKEEMDGFIVAIKNEVDMSEAIGIFLQAYEIQSEEERNIFIYELELFAKSIRKWSLKGYTEDEVQKANARVVNEVKIGRNDPCICGSGKKYKKCCG